jgi:hypothetical protein
MKPRITNESIDNLLPDNLNANKGTEYGTHLIEKSFRELGAGRSILLDKNNRIIAGNKSTETAVAIGLKNVIIIETDGTQLVAVKRTDIDIDSKQGRELALADNATSKANLQWEPTAIAKIQEDWDVDPEEWGIFIPEEDQDAKSNPESSMGSTSSLVIHCDEPGQLLALHGELMDRGFKCEMKQ